MNGNQITNKSDNSNSIKLVLTEAQINNIMVFLDRVRYNGFKEINAVQEIISVLQNGMSNGQVLDGENKNTFSNRNYPENL